VHAGSGCLSRVPLAPHGWRVGRRGWRQREGRRLGGEETMRGSVPLPRGHSAL
jgi:hypothetical protein